MCTNLPERVSFFAVKAAHAAGPLQLIGHSQCAGWAETSSRHPCRGVTDERRQRGLIYVRWEWKAGLWQPGEQEARSQWQHTLLWAAAAQTLVFGEVFAQVRLTFRLSVCGAMTMVPPTSPESSRLETDLFCWRLHKRELHSLRGRITIFRSQWRRKAEEISHWGYGSLRNVDIKGHIRPDVLH